MLYYFGLTIFWIVVLIAGVVIINPTLRRNTRDSFRIGYDEKQSSKKS